MSSFIADILGKIRSFFSFGKKTEEPIKTTTEPATVKVVEPPKKIEPPPTQPPKPPAVKPTIAKDPKIEKLYPGLREHAYNFMEDARKINAYLFCGVRTFEEQAGLYAQGRSKPGIIITNAGPGYSYHNYGLAIDVVFKNKNGWTWNSERWNELGRLGNGRAFEWGGSWTKFPDRPHFQIIYKQPIGKLLAIYNQRKQLADVWRYLDTLV
ncbi:MAG: M15 family metallopeptidase [bacterium]